MQRHHVLCHRTGPLHLLTAQLLQKRDDVPVGAPRDQVSLLSTR
ncbi:hypothetical protein [Streptomyces sp. NPDC002855]